MATTVHSEGRQLHRGVGVIGLTFFALGSVIGSGWLFGARNAASVAGPASIISWPLAGVMILVIILSFAELSPAYPVAGGMYRLAHYSYGGLGGFVMGWVSWLFSMSLIAIEVEAALTYLSGLHGLTWLVDANGDLTVPGGFLIAVGLALVFALINMYGVKLFAESNTIVVWWKIAIPVLTIIALLFSLKGSNFTAAGGFLPKATSDFGGVKGIFLALPLAVVFSEIGFDSAIQMAGEARNPKKDLIRAVIWSTVIGVIVYTLLQVVFIGAMPAKYLHAGWAGMATVFVKNIHGPYVIMASVAGLAWLTYLLYVDAAVSPSGTGFIYTGTQARLLYGMGKEGYLPPGTQKLNSNGVPWISVLVGWAGSVLLFLPFPSWSSLVGAITSVAVISYCAGPAALNHFRKVDPDRERGWRVPAPKVIAPLGFIFGTLMVYWTGWGVMWRVDGAIILGLLIMGGYYFARPKDARPHLDVKHSSWIWIWLVGLNLFALFGAFNGWPDSPTPEQLDSWYHPVNGLLKFPYDTIWVAIFAILIYYFAQATALPAEKTREYIAGDAEEAKVTVGTGDVAETVS
ncbi:MAG: APC family permease [Nocardiopsaceae bacterium]|nr:APC family permease [Nocardiopsaceae bacterium]